MAIDFNQTFGRNANSNRASTPKEDLPVAQYWLNVGYAITVTNEDDETSEQFVSLPVGIPLDTMKLLKTNQQNEFFAGLQGARNDLWQQMMDACKPLKAGESKIIALDTESGLSLQLRRVNDEKPALKAADNPFAKKLAFA